MFACLLLRCNRATVGGRTHSVHRKLWFPLRTGMGWFPCVSQFKTQKNNFSFKKRYCRTNLGMMSYNQHFLYAGVSTPGSVHDSRARLWKNFERVFFAAIFACVGWNSEKNRKGDLSYSSQLYYRKADVFKNTNPWNT